MSDYSNVRGGMTLEEIGQVMGVTRERVRQIEAMALRKLRRNPKTRRMFEEILKLRAVEGRKYAIPSSSRGPSF